MKNMQNSIMEKIKNNHLEENDTFKFGCNQCGECCRNRHDILLSPYDLYRISKYLKIKISGVIEKYCECYIGQDSKLPVVRAKPKTDNFVCPFLNKGKCSIHEVKPVICAMFPLGRATDAEGCMKYFYSGGCGCANKTEVSLKDWIERFKLKESEEPAKLWGQILAKICTAKMRIKSTQELENRFAQIFLMIYLNYREDEDFMPQFKKNAEFICFAFEKIYGKSLDDIMKKEKCGGLSGLCKEKGESCE